MSNFLSNFWTRLLSVFASVLNVLSNCPRIFPNNTHLWKKTLEFQTGGRQGSGGRPVRPVQLKTYATLPFQTVDLSIYIYIYIIYKNIYIYIERSLFWRVHYCFGVDWTDSCRGSISGGWNSKLFFHGPVFFGKIFGQLDKTFKTLAKTDKSRVQKLDKKLDMSKNFWTEVFNYLRVVPTRYLLRAV